MGKSLFIKGNIVDLFENRMYPAEIEVDKSHILSISPIEESLSNYIVPGFVDSHVHIESSMLTPSRFAEAAVRHGTVATVSDPHEIANVLGVKGVDAMIKNGFSVPLKFFFGAPSCVPATNFETSGHAISSIQIEELLKRNDIYYLAEVMNYVGVISGDGEVFSKIAAARAAGKKIDGHAPGLRGEDLSKYINAGITTDHECVDLSEAEEKIKKGMVVQIREGSAAKNFDSLLILIDKYPDRVMLCTDDSHPDDLVSGHINKIVANGLSKGVNLYNLLRAASVNPVTHYNIDVGLLREGDPADFIVTNDLETFMPESVYINGDKVMSNKRVWFTPSDLYVSQDFRSSLVKPEDFRVKTGSGKMKVIGAKDKELFTEIIHKTPKLDGNLVVPDPQNDICKIAVINKYEAKSPSAAFVSGFGLKIGAIGGSIAHDSHNIIVIGTDDENMAKIANEIIKSQGGIAATTDSETKFLQLEIGGLMTNASASVVAEKYLDITKFVQQKMGSPLNAPFMTLSFMALLVIPEIKIGDKGLFNVNEFKFTGLFEQK